MRVTEHLYPSGGCERRDVLAQDWSIFIAHALSDSQPVLLPNHKELALNLLQSLPIAGLILSGGDDWGLYRERDSTETALLNYAEQVQLPVLGVCRGAQIINRYCGGKQRSFTFQPRGGAMGVNHLASRHLVTLRSGELVSVNSYHEKGFFPEDLSPVLGVEATAEDGSVEAFFHRSLPW